MYGVVQCNMKQVGVMHGQVFLSEKSASAWPHSRRLAVGGTHYSAKCINTASTWICSSNSHIVLALHFCAAFISGVHCTCSATKRGEYKKANLLNM